MASTIGNVVDRLYRDYLTPPDDQPAQAPLAAGITISATTITLTASHMSQVEIDAIGAGTILECGQELFRVLLVSQSSTTITATVAARGTVLGTAAAVHATGDPVILRPKPARRTAFDAVSDAVVALWPTLAAVRSVAYSTGAGSFIEVAADVEEVLDFRYAAYETGYSISRYDEAAVELLPYPFAPATVTGRAIQLGGAPLSRDGYLRYLARFARPTAEADTFTTLGLDESWMLLIIYGALLRVIAPSDLGARQQAFITRSMETQGFPVGSGRSLGQTLMQVYEYLLDQARKGFQARFPMRQSFAQL